jgi:hypothetical protein
VEGIGAKSVAGTGIETEILSERRVEISYRHYVNTVTLNYNGQ